MKTKEWALIINSLMLQLAVGTITLIALFRGFASGEASSEMAVNITTQGLFLVGPIGVAGIIAAFFHLGNPARAIRALSNIKTSWLSREIFFTNVFLGLWFITYALEFLGKPNTLFLWLSVVAGFVALWSMASIYYVTKRPGWFSANTYVGFFGTAVIFGSASMALMLVGSGGEEQGDTSLLITASICAVAILCVRVVLELKLIPTLKPTQAMPGLNNLACAARKVEDVVPLYKKLAIGGLASSIVGGLMLLAVLNAGEGSGMFAVVVSALLILLGETASRSGFYTLGPQKWV
jgi:anaerobic dimethyl sulfoxide reductase subunit C (anchor subunit)